MQFGVIVAPTVRDLFVEKLQSMILSGRLSVGERLPSERALAEEMRVSKTVIHAGLKDLERMGFVEVRGRQGTFVSNYAENGTLETLAAILKYNGGRLDYQNVQSILEMRLAVEGQAVRLFAARHIDADILALRSMIDQVRAARQGGRAEAAHMLYRFHHFLCLRSGNTIFPLMMKAFRDISLVFWENSIRLLGFDGSVHILETLTDLLEQRDGEGAVAFLSDHFDHYLEQMRPQTGA